MWRVIYSRWVFPPPQLSLCVSRFLAISQEHSRHTAQQHRRPTLHSRPGTISVEQVGTGGVQQQRPPQPFVSSQENTTQSLPAEVCVAAAETVPVGSDVISELFFTPATPSPTVPSPSRLRVLLPPLLCARSLAQSTRQHREVLIKSAKMDSPAWRYRVSFPAATY